MSGTKVTLGVALLLCGCASYASTNRILERDRTALPATPPASRASFACDEPRGNPDVMVVLALSGGGSRAAWLAADFMLELERRTGGADGTSLLDEVDAISSVSGGSLPAAYYCLSADAAPGGVVPDGRPAWERETVTDLMTRNYVARGIGNWFWPHNVLRYWFTAFDRSDIMAQTFADNMYDGPWGRDYTLGELNPGRPYLLLNATDATRPWNSDELDGPQDRYGEPFTFTAEDFAQVLDSDVNAYHLGRAVMASAAFPAAFSHMTLRDFRVPAKEGPRYLHVFDGGNSDNLGLLTVKRLLRRMEQLPPGQRPARYVVISVDAYTRPQGVASTEPDPRSAVDFLVDRNFLDAVDMLLTLNRLHVLEQFLPGEEFDLMLESTAQQPWVQQSLGKAASREVPRALAGPSDARGEDWEPRDLGERLLFWHVTFEDVGRLADGSPTGRPERRLRRRLFGIPTSFAIADDAVVDIHAAVDILLREDHGSKLEEVLAVLGR